jgi:Fe-S cluster biogenesis protein NfuA/nitrite reductase/ring-hydroxylating ferredoxin subunit
MSLTAETRTDASEQLFAQVQELQDSLESAPDSATKDVALELVSAVVQLYGEGLDRILTMLFEAGEGAAEFAAGLPEDPLLATLLLIHDLHPVALEQRVQDALESVRPYMESHGGNVELLSLQNGVATINLKGSCSDCSASAVTLELAIKQALEEHAPDLLDLVVEGTGPQSITGAALPMASSGLPMIDDAPSSAWVDLPGAATLTDNEFSQVIVAGRSLVVADLDGVLLAYEDCCAKCAAPLHDGNVSGGSLSCPSCGTGYLLARAGRAKDDEALQLVPVPLLRTSGSVKVAIAV